MVQVGVGERSTEAGDQSSRVAREDILDTLAAAVITSPLRNGKQRFCLGDTLEGMRLAGLPAPQVFAEPKSWVPDHVTAIWQVTRQGSWRNRLCAWEWMMENTNAEFLLVAEDDTVWARDVTIGWPAHNAVYLSLYRPWMNRKLGVYVSSDEITEPGSPYQRIHRGSFMGGSLAIVMPRRFVELLLVQTQDNWKHPNRSDVRLNRFGDRHGTRWVCNPSLVDHRIDQPSACGGPPPSCKHMRAQCTGNA